MLDASRKHVGDRFDAAMRVPGKSLEVLGRVVVAEIVEQQEGIEFTGIAEAEAALQLHAGAFERRLRSQDFFDGSYGHVRTSK